MIKGKKREEKKEEKENRSIYKEEGENIWVG